MNIDYKLIKQIIAQKNIGAEVEIRGWLRTKRDSKGISFLNINDGSCLAGIQVVADAARLENYHSLLAQLTTGCSLRVRGKLIKSPARGQEVELPAAEIEIYGLAPAGDYPLQKKRHSFEFLRTISHLRPRTNTFSAMTRMRSTLAQAIHDFFRLHDFYQVHTPIITTSDCEGAGEMFSVTSLDLPELARQHESDLFDYSRDFFGCPASLTVSGQLEAEAYALALGRVYTFGPTFRAENSHTSRHLAEFWMLEPEMAFFDLEDDMDLAENLLKFLIGVVFEQCREDFDFFSRFVDKSLFEKLRVAGEHDFSRISYSEAVDLLRKSGRNFDYQVEWGTDLQAEHERFLAEDYFKGPVIVFNYPQAIKPFYMRQNDDNRTVAAMDVLLPGIGEIIGGSQREERYDYLLARMEEERINTADYEWYLDLRRYGTVVHSGFGLGFERLIQFVTGLGNIRDVIPFPRTPGSAVG
jgi:asparaginyl-tRNA synthetase